MLEVEKKKIFLFFHSIFSWGILTKDLMMISDCEFSQLFMLEKALGQRDAGAKAETPAKYSLVWNV